MIVRYGAAIALVVGHALVAQQPAPRPVPEANVYFEFQVQKQVTARPNNPAPHYPDSLRTQNGEVLMQFVVDTTGHADTSMVKVLKSTHPLFTAEVRRVLPLMEFVPAEIDGHRVKQLVQMPFLFTFTPDKPPARPPAP